MAETDPNKPKPSTDHIIIEASVLSSVTEPSQSSSLARLHAGYFQISLSLSSQAWLWKILIIIVKSKNQSQSQIFNTSFLILWWLAAASQIVLSLLYILKCFLHFKMVKAEFLHHIGVNILYAPWISWLILLQSSPTVGSAKFSQIFLCWVFSIPILILDIKLYGQWITTEKRFLSVLANPTCQISVIANLMVARAAAETQQKEVAICMFSLGMMHYLVLFVTLYQRCSGSHSFPAILRPAFFLFFAAPSMGSSAWNSISGTFDSSSKMLFFLSLFLFLSLTCRPALFKKSVRKFSVAWWAYSFPLTFLSLAAVEYEAEVKGYVASKLMLILSALSVLVFIGLMLLTALNLDGLLHENDPVLRLVNNSVKRT